MTGVDRVSLGKNCTATQKFAAANFPLRPLALSTNPETESEGWTFADV